MRVSLCFACPFCLPFSASFSRFELFVVSGLEIDYMWYW